MADHPKWDYWMYEDLGEGRLLPIDHFHPISDDDIRNDKYRVDRKKWCRKYFWKPDEAALISFIRDPEKITAELISFDEDDFQREEHVALCKHMSALCDLIVSEQGKGRLDHGFFPPEKYVEWAKQVGVSIPPCITKELEVVRLERERIYEAYAADQELNANSIETTQSIGCCRGRYVAKESGGYRPGRLVEWRS
jgi:hypothetical protein